MIKFDALEGMDVLSRRLKKFSETRPVRGLAALASFLVISASADAKIIYVNGANATSGDGTEWSKAFIYLQNALEEAAPGDQIYLAKGTYYPDDYLPIGGVNKNYGDRELSFELNQVTLYGGFSGTETRPDQRDLGANPTILSGEIWSGKGEDIYWSLHVVTLMGSATLDGVTIQKGNANGDDAFYNQGGACYAPPGVTLTLRNCTLADNRANDSGGAVWGDVVATDCTFTNNQVISHHLFTSNCSGGAINGNATVTNCVFSGNLVDAKSTDFGSSSIAAGGAIAGATVTASHCVFDGNSILSHATTKGSATADALGGAILISEAATAKYCTFANNKADSVSKGDAGASSESMGGAIAGPIKASNCSFSKNQISAIADSGNPKSPPVEQASGGALYAMNSSALMNCTFTENTTNDRGGAIHAAKDSQLTISNSTFLDNAAAGKGAALSCGGRVIIISNIFWNNADLNVDGLDQSNLIHVLALGGGRISSRAYPTPSTETKNLVNHGVVSITKDDGSDVRIGVPENTIVTEDPMFVDGMVPAGVDGIWRTSDDGLRLNAESPAIGIGHPLFVPTDILDLDEDGDLTEEVPVDAASYTRIQDGTLDLGAYEYGDRLHIPDISVEQPTSVALVDEVSVVDFGSAPGTPLTKTFTIKNTGLASLNGLLVTKRGENEGDFSFTQPLNSSLASGDSTTFTVTFEPTVAGLRSASIKIASNDPDEAPFDVNVRGEALVPDIAIEQPVGTDLTDGVSLVDYKTVSVLSATTKVFTIRNNGQAKLNILGLTSTGVNAKDFKVSSPGQSLIAPGGSTTFKITFAPSKEGVRSSSIIVQSNDPDDESFFVINVKGNGTVAPEIAVKQPASVDLIDGESKSFGSVKTGLSYTKTFTIRNVGSAKLKNIAVSLSGSSAFTKSKLSVTSLMSGTKATFTVTFSPKSAGEKNAMLRIVSNDEDENPFDIKLTGTGNSGRSSAAPSALAVISTSSGVSPATDLRHADNGGVVTVLKASDGLEYLVLTVPKTLDWGVARRTAEVSPNLVDWFSGDKHTTTLVDDAAMLRVRDNTPVKKGEKRYIRLK